jgi:peptide deformylase
MAREPRKDDGRHGRAEGTGDQPGHYLRVYPDPVLRLVAKPVREFDRRLRDLVAEMIEIMYDSDGIGLAAPQIGVSLRVFVVDVPEADGRSAKEGAHGGPDSLPNPPTATDGPMVCINPEITFAPGGVTPFEEGCLSLPEIRGEVLRPPVVTLRAFDVEGHEYTRRGAGLLSRCWQHELDHLDGVLIIDKMTQSSRLKNKGAIRALEREAE